LIAVNLDPAPELNVTQGPHLPNLDFLLPPLYLRHLFSLRHLVRNGWQGPQQRLGRKVPLRERQRQHPLLNLFNR
jgi:hypothetical protein